MEEWRNIEGYNDYQVSNYGRVESLERIDCLGRLKKGKVLKPYKNPNGYLRVLLYKNGRRQKCSVHRIVAQAFIVNPDNLPCINHRDECKTNNHVENLEWCDTKYNLNYNDGQKRRAIKRSKTIYQYTLNGEFVKEWKSATEVQRQTGYNQGYICQCCNGKRKQAYDYIWKYV